MIDKAKIVVLISVMILIIGQVMFKQIAENYNKVKDFPKTQGGGKDFFIKFKNKINSSDHTFPLIPIIDHNLCDAYANNFCLQKNILKKLIILWQRTATEPLAA